jgi:hypothetical protein
MKNTDEGAKQEYISISCLGNNPADVTAPDEHCFALLACARDRAFALHPSRIATFGSFPQFASQGLTEI